MSPSVTFKRGIPTPDEFRRAVDDMARTYVASILTIARDAIWAYTPIDRGNMLKWLLRSQIEKPAEGFYRGMIGPMSELDYDRSVVGAGFLQNFVDDYGRKFVGGKPGYEAWKTMNYKAKRELQWERRSGNERYGGKVIDGFYAPRYLGAVDKGHVPGAGMSVRVGFMGKIVTTVEAEVSKQRAILMRYGMAGIGYTSVTRFANRSDTSVP